MRTFTELETRILKRIQRDIKISETPFSELSNDLSIEEDELIAVMQRLKDDNIIRDISAIFNAGALGYESTLVAFEVEDYLVDRSAGIINDHPGVSHNYLRRHKYNIWFTIAVIKDSSLEKTVAALAEKCKAKDYLILKNEKLFKIRLMLDPSERMEYNKRGETEEVFEHQSITSFNNIREITPEERNAVNILQIDLPLVKRPFKYLINSKNIDIKEERIPEIAEIFKKDGIIRRYSAILKHHNVGYNYNAMTAWKIKDFGHSAIQDIFASVPNISHLYLRTVYPGRWEYPLFAMIHAKSREELITIIKGLEQKSGIDDYLVLDSIQEFKKKRVAYFSKEFNEWESLNL